MKIKQIGIILLVLIAFGSVGCSYNPRVYYVGDKAYAKNPETDKVLSWEHEAPDNRDIDSYDYPRGRLPLTPIMGSLIEK